MPEKYSKIKTLANQGSFGKVDLVKGDNSGIKYIQKTIDMTDMDDE
jgi:hypothetical protein